MLQAIRRMRALPPSARAILRRKSFEGRYTTGNLLSLLGPVAEFDHANDSARGKLGCLMAIVIAGLIGSAIFLGDVAGHALAITAGTLALFLIVLGWLLRRLFVLDASDNLRRVALPFIAVLREDMAAETPLQVRIDLSKADIASKKLKSDPPYERGRYYRIVDTHYRDPWFDGEAQLLDGCRLRWSVVDEVTESTRSKKNARRKHKTKTKYYKCTRLALQLSAPLKRFRLREARAAGGDVLETRQSDRRCTLDLKRKLKQQGNHPFDVDQLLNAVARLYQQLEPLPREQAR